MTETGPGTRASGPASLFPLLEGLRVLLGLSIVLSGADIALRLWGIGAFHEMVTDPTLRLAHRFDHISEVLGVTSWLLVLLCGVCWFVWQWRLVGLAPDYVKWSRGWHLGAWVVPIANLWWPYRNMRDLGRLYLPPAQQPFVAGWWIVLVADSVLARILARTHAPHDSVTSLQRYESWFVASDILNVVAAVLAATLVARLTDGAAIVLVPEDERP